MLKQSAEIVLKARGILDQSCHMLIGGLRPSTCISSEVWGQIAWAKLVMCPRGSSLVQIIHIVLKVVQDLTYSESEGVWQQSFLVQLSCQSIFKLLPRFMSLGLHVGRTRKQKYRTNTIVLWKNVHAPYKSAKALPVFLHLTMKECPVMFQWLNWCF